MKYIFVAMGVSWSVYSMSDKYIDRMRINARKDPVLMKELEDIFFIELDQDCDVRNEQLDVNFYRYRNMLAKKKENEEKLIVQNRKKEAQRIEILYSKISILCIILGHISGMW